MESQEDSSYNSEVDSDPESDPDNPEKLLNAWLGELDNLTVVSGLLLGFGNCGSESLCKT